MYMKVKNWFKENFYKKEIFTYIKFLLICISIYILFVGHLFWKLSYTPSYIFDKKEWFENINKRYRYGKNIEESKMLLGLDTIEIKKIIGLPSIRLYNQWDYNLGISTEGTGFGFGFNNLRIKFKDSRIDSLFFSNYID